MGKLGTGNMRRYKGKGKEGAVLKGAPDGKMKGGGKGMRVKHWVRVERGTGNEKGMRGTGRKRLKSKTEKFHLEETSKIEIIKQE